MAGQGRWYTPAKVVLLTGAGFTKTFGGYLGSEMWASILNQREIAENPKIQDALLEDLNYETVYDKILYYQAFDNRQKLAFLEATIKAYKELHEIIFEEENTAKASAACRQFISRFVGKGKERGFFFTLNHDLFIEQFYSLGSSYIAIPGLHHSDWFNRRIQIPLSDERIVRLPGEEVVEISKQTFWNKSSGGFVYVKLHGSYGWWGEHHGKVMVIGHSKTEMIQNEPILKWYSQLFHEVLNQPSQKLVVIGYGFRDPHINEEIANAIRNKGLKLYVVSPLQPADFKKSLIPLHGVREGPLPTQAENIIWKGLAGYYCGTVADLFSINQSVLPPMGQVFFRQLGLMT